MSDTLRRICEDKRVETAARRRLSPHPDTTVATTPRSLLLGDFGVIAEVKRASPSAGQIASHVDAVAQARKYAFAGAAAVSVLTDTPYFGGQLVDLTDVRAAVDVPVLRKDFILDPYQVEESRAAGADLVLLIVVALDPFLLRDLAVQIRELGMTPLVEVHHLAEVPVALEALADGGLLGVNARNLGTLQVDLDIWEQAADCLVREAPSSLDYIAESGVRTPSDAWRAQAAGYRGVLCGEALMRAPDPVAFLGEMCRTGL